MELQIANPKTVYSKTREYFHVTKHQLFSSNSVSTNGKNVMDGVKFMNKINQSTITACFFDPQYRGIMDKMSYGNEGERQKERALLSQMNNDTIIEFIREINRVLVASGHLFLWIDKFHLCEGIEDWFKKTEFSIVDLITWDKGKIGMGYRTRRRSEYLMVLQKEPIRAKGIWIKHNIPDTWIEKIAGKIHPHQKPMLLQKSLIEAVSSEKDYILDPCAGSYSVLEACKLSGRNFIGCDIKTV